MNQNVASGGQPDEQNLFKPSEVVTSDPAPAQTAPSTSPSEDQATVPAVASSLPSAEAVHPSSMYQPGSITWTASEFVAHQKSAGWYMVLTFVSLAVAALIWLLTKDMFSAGMVLAGALILGIYAARKPNQLTYVLDSQGLTIGNRHYGFGEFRSFSVIPEGPFSSIELTPLRRFAMYTAMYVDPADEAKITDMLSSYLPMEPPRHDLIDQLMRRIRF